MYTGLGNNREASGRTTAASILTARDIARIEDAANIVARDYGTRWTAERLARAVGLSARVLQQGLKERYGCTFRELLKDIRIEAAAKMLLARKPSGEVAITCGFGTHATLSATFKKVTGIFPSHYFFKAQGNYKRQYTGTCPSTDHQQIS